jgi:putative aldouronate transport system substrate-binding protein
MSSGLPGTAIHHSKRGLGTMIGRNKRKGMLGTKKAVLTIGLACSLLFTACSANTKEEASGDANGGASKEKVTLKVEVFDRGNSPAGSTITDNYMTDFIQKNFGDPSNINMEFVPVPRSEEVEKLNVLMASGSNVPDIVFTYDPNTFNRYAKQGGLTDLGPLLNEAPMYSAMANSRARSSLYQLSGRM